MGMGEMFTANADLSGLLTSREKLTVSTVVHKAFIAIDEQGAKAAAATGEEFVFPLSFIHGVNGYRKTR